MISESRPQAPNTPPTFPSLRRRAREDGPAGGAGAAADINRAGCSGCVLFRMLPGREKVVLGVDAVVALIGIVYCGGDAYLVARDSYFLE